MGAAMPIIAGLGSLYGMHQANKERQKTDEQSKNLTNLANTTSIPAGKQFMGQSQQAIGPTLGYYTSMLSNPREATAPEQNRISSMYAGQAANARTMAPRGGMALSAAENLRSQERGAQENVIQNARPMAASALGNLGTNLGSLGFQGFGQGAGILGNVFQQGLQARQQQTNEGQNIGSGLFNAYQMYMLQNAMNPGGGQASPGSVMGGMYPNGIPTVPSNPWGGSQPNVTGGLYGGVPNSGFSGPH